ncbi:MAG: PD-(D/E)XK nuclease family transposase [Lachnospiraceae bacterium]|nr:PD-(D/E)XK nuclease family transposase [Lachnospiraceae bacterium]
MFLDDPVLIVLDHTPQYTVTNLQGRSVILDAHCRLGDGREVDIEVQNADDDDHQRRVRYNGALLTANTADPGIKFERISDVCVIFISRFDIFEDGFPLYHIDRTVRETGKVVRNGFEEIYVNSAVKDGSDVSELMEVFTSQTAYSDKFPVTSSEKHRYRETEKGQDDMCAIVEKYRAEGKAEGKAEERQNILVTLTENLMKQDPKLSKEEAADKAKKLITVF